jgi:DNA-binding MarR family transcriptional regulator
LPVFFAGIANKWSRGASKVFLNHFGVGALDWVVISMMAIEPGISALRICQGTASDKASVSRCLTQLEAKGLIVGKAQGRDPRRRMLELTPAGYDLHDQLLAIALERERLLLQGLSETEIETLIGLLRRVQGNVIALQERDSAAVSSDILSAW